MAKKSKNTNAFVFTKSDTQEIRFELSEYKGKVTLNMREWFGEDDDEVEDYKPGRGFTIPLAMAGDFLESLSEWAADVKFEPPAVEIKKGSRVVFKNGDEGVVKKIKDDVAFVVVDGDDDDELTRVKLSKLEALPEKKKKKSKKDKKEKKVKSANEAADEELSDLDDVEDEDEKPKKKKKKAKKKSKSL